MKKILILLLILAGCKTPEKVLMTPRSASVSLTNINVGTTPNDGTGDKLRDAMIKINTNNDAIEAFAATVPTEAEVSAEIADSNNARLAAALDLADYAVMKTDSNGYDGDYITRPYLESVIGSGSAGKFYILSGNVDDTGFPAAGDTSLTHTNFVGKHLTVVREGQIQQQHANNTTQDGFWLDNATGIIRFRPALSAGEQLEIWSTSTIQWEALTAEGGGAESTLLTGLRAGWQLNEVSGVTVNDVLDTYDGTTTGTVNQPGKFGVAETFVRASAQWANMGQTVQDVGTNDFTLAAWFNISTSPSATMGIAGCVYDLPYYYIGINDEDKAYAIINFGSGNITLIGNSALSTGTWYHLALTVDRSGNATLFVNGSSQTDVEDVSAGVAVNLANNNSFAIGAVGNLAGYTFNGSIDDVYLWTKVLSGAELTTLQTKTYPWN